MTSTSDDLGPFVRVSLLGLPVRLQSAVQEHMDGLRREFMLLAEGMRQTGEPSADLPVRLLEVVDALNGRYASFVSRPETELAAAVEAEKESVDLVYEVPTAAAGAARELGSLLDEADVYCSEGEHLLTLATPPDLLLYRRWFLEQFVEQIAGAEPVPWPAYARAYAGT